VKKNKIEKSRRKIEDRKLKNRCDYKEIWQKEDDIKI
jgi:hypothetical protein